MHDKVRGDVGARWHPAAVAIISAIIGSGGGIALVFNTPIGAEIARPDPYTGTQASALEQRIGHVESDVNNHISQHPDASLDARLQLAEVDIGRLQAQYELIIANQARILNRLDNR